MLYNLDGYRLSGAGFALGGKTTVLIVDDRNICDLLRLYLHGEGYDLARFKGRAT